MNRKEWILLLLCSVSTVVVYGQNAVPSAGGTAQGSAGSVSYTVGQVAYTTARSPAGSVSQGVQQAYVIEDEPLPDDIGNVQIECMVYPNPAADFLTVSIPELSGGFELRLLNADGRTVADRHTVSSDTELDMSAMVQGTYILKVFQNSDLVKSFKIIKKQ